MIFSPVALNPNLNPILQSNVAQIPRLVIRGNLRIIACNLSDGFPLSSSPCPVSDAANQAKNDQTAQDQLNKHQENRDILYESMDMAGKVLSYVEVPKGSKFKNRVCVCGKFIRSIGQGGKGYITLSVDKDTHHSSIDGAIWCDGAWVCAPCAVVNLNKKAKQITTVQRRFLEEGIDKNWSTWLLTLTIPHTNEDPLNDLIAKKACCYVRATCSFTNESIQKARRYERLC